MARDISARSRHCGVGDVDVAATWLSGHGDDLEVWRYYRENDPVSLQTAGDESFWSVTKYRDVNRVLRDSRVFSSERGTLLNLIGQGDPAAGRQMAATDPPRHRRVRAPLQRALSLRNMELRASTIRAYVDEQLVPLRDGAIDFAATISQVPIAAIASLMDLPRSDWSMLTRWATAALAHEDPNYALDTTPAATLMRSHREIFGYFQELVTARKRNGADGAGLIDVLLNSENEGQRIGIGEVVANCYSLLIGATVTTPQVPNWAIHELAGSGELEKWHSSPTLFESGMDEAIRWASPTNHFMRYATEDVRLGNRNIRAGEAVVVWLGSANRDEDEFPDADQFIVSRQPNRHIAFGVGPHYCIGHTIARVAIRAVFASLIDEFVEFSLAGQPRMLRSNVIRGIASLPVSAVPRDRIKKEVTL